MLEEVTTLYKEIVEHKGERYELKVGLNRLFHEYDHIQKTRYYEDLIVGSIELVEKRKYWFGDKKTEIWERKSHKEKEGVAKIMIEMVQEKMEEIKNSK